MNMRTIILVTIIVSAATFGGGAASGQEGSQAFFTKSKNIECIYYPTYVDGPFLECLVLNYTGKIPKQPADCDLDWSPQASLETKGRPQIFSCRGDTPYQPYAPVVAYGSTWKRGPFTCSVATIGVTCRNASKRGFFVSRTSIRAL